MSCQFCSEAQPRYSCPRCNAAYCSLACYQKPVHQSCSEQFYKESVEAELVLRSKEDADNPVAKKKMIETLKRLHQQEVEAPIVGEGSHKGDELEENDLLDSDDEVDLSERLAEVNLDDADAVWSNLTEEERREFERLVDTGDIAKMVPEYKAWWNRRLVEHKIQEVEREEERRAEEMEFKKKCPDVAKNIPPMSLFLKAAPSPLLKLGLLNALYPYVYCHR
jgi:hypothetical protein